MYITIHTTEEKLEIISNDLGTPTSTIVPKRYGWHRAKIYFDPRAISIRVLATKNVI